MEGEGERERVCRCHIYIFSCENCCLVTSFVFSVCICCLQQNAASQIFKRLSAKSKLRDVLLLINSNKSNSSSGGSEEINAHDAEVIREIVVRIIQSTWRMRKSRRLVAGLKAEKDDLVLQAAAKKLQRCFRIRQLQKLTNRHVATISVKAT